MGANTSFGKLLIIPTPTGIMAIHLPLLQFVPGGPIEKEFPKGPAHKHVTTEAEHAKPDPPDLGTPFSKTGDLHTNERRV